MILADKIIENRKKNGWSQEDLAYKLGVSRQSVSKWEGAQSVPDMKKIVQMSELFGVSTDYLLKDEIEDPAPGEAETVPEVRYDDEETRNVSMEEANEFLASNEKHAGRISTGVMLCILSPVFLIVLAGIVDAKWINMSVKAVTGTGITVLLLLVAAAVGIFVTSGMALSRFDYLEKNRIETEYGVSGMVRRMKEEHMPYYTRDVVIGVILFIVSVIPVIGVSLAFGDGSVPAPLISGTGSVTGLISICTGLLLVLVAIGVKLIVKTSTIKGGMDKLLEEGDYTRINKKIGRFDGIYWAVVLAIYLGWSFITMRWELTWIVWPIAGVLFAAYREIMKAVVRGRN